MFRFILQSWVITKTLSFFGAHHIAARIESIRYAQTGAYCAIVMHGDTDVECINAGRILERLWLVATKLKLGVQPTFATMIIQRVLKDEPERYSKSQHRLIRNAVRQINNIFGIGQNEKIVCMFRTGEGTAVPLQSLRKDPDIMFIE